MTYSRKSRSLPSGIHLAVTASPLLHLEPCCVLVEKLFDFEFLLKTHRLSHHTFHCGMRHFCSVVASRVRQISDKGSAMLCRESQVRSTASHETRAATGDPCMTRHFSAKMPPCARLPGVKIGYVQADPPPTFHECNHNTKMLDSFSHITGRLHGCKARCRGAKGCRTFD